MQQHYKETLITYHHLDSDSYAFSLKKIDTNLRVQDVSVNFPMVAKTQPQLRMQEDYEDQAPLNSYPVFNYDYKYYTPCFIVDADRFKTQRNAEFYFEYHCKRVNECNQEKSQIFLPKPSQKHTHCSICRKGYQDYLQHVESLAHKEKLKKGKLAKNIGQLVKLMTKKEKRREKLSKKLQKQLIIKEKQIKKETKVAAKYRKQSKMQLAKDPSETQSQRVQL